MVSQFSGILHIFVICVYTSVESGNTFDTGSVVPPTVNLLVNGNWIAVDFDTTIPVNTELTIDLLDGSDDSIIIPDISSGQGILEIATSLFKLQATLLTAGANSTPVLRDWSITCIDSSGPSESDWSNVVASKQCDLPGDSEPDCDVDMTNYAILWK